MLEVTFVMNVAIKFHQQDYTQLHYCMQLISPTFYK